MAQNYRKALSTILKEASEASNWRGTIKVLQDNNSMDLRTILKMALDKKIEWLLPPGEPPFKPCQTPGQEGRLYHEIPKMGIFLNIPGNNLRPKKRENLFVELLENLELADAKLLCAVKDKYIPYNRITANLVNKAFPQLIEDPVTSNEKEETDETEVKQTN